MATRPGATLVPLLVAALALTGCSASGGASGNDQRSARDRPGCGVVAPARVVGLVGTAVAVTSHGSLDGLRRDHRRLVCTTVAADRPGQPARPGRAGRAARSVRVVATYHPAPYRLPRRACQAGWVFAGSPDKYAPACQQGLGRGGRTRLVVRWQPYLMTVTVDRPDRGWGGDPEIALAISRDLARRLGVREATGER